MLSARFNRATPEQQASADSADARADLCSVAVTFYRMLTGRLPTDPPPPPAEFNSDLDESWNEFILRGMARHPNRGYADAEEVLEVLRARERLAYAPGQDPPPADCGAPIVDPSRRRGSRTAR